MKNKLISIIVPIYMVEKYLEKCIISIINQTYSNLEIILVNDGSKDNCLSICKKYAKQDKRIKIIDKENGGLGDARNAGIDIAQGIYIGFVDSDDYIEKDMYKKLVSLLEKNNADISICNYKMVYEENLKNIEKKYKDKSIEIYDKKEAIYKLLEEKNITSHAWNKLYKKELFDNIRYPKRKKYEDIGTTFYLFDRANKIVYTDQVLYNYLQRKDSILQNKTIDLFKNKVEMEHKREKYLKQKGYNKENIDRTILITYINTILSFKQISDNNLYNSKLAKYIYVKIRKTKLFYGMKILNTTKKKLEFFMLKISKNFTYFVLNYANFKWREI